MCIRDRTEKLEELKVEIVEKYEVNVLSLSFDIQKYEDVSNAVSLIPQEFKPIDILINNAGLASGLDYIHEGDLGDWETMIDTNVKGLLYITRLISPEMVKNKSGHIINICSTAGKDAYARGNVYLSLIHI